MRLGVGLAMAFDTFSLKPNIRSLVSSVDKSLAAQALRLKEHLLSFFKVTRL